jgi:hypothetical protein
MTPPVQGVQSPDIPLCARTHGRNVRPLHTLHTTHQGGGGSGAAGDSRRCAGMPRATSVPTSPRSLVSRIRFHAAFSRRSRGSDLRRCARVGMVGPPSLTVVGRQGAWVYAALTCDDARAEHEVYVGSGGGRHGH